MPVRVVPILKGLRWEPNAPEAEFAVSDSGLACLVLRAHPDDADQNKVALYWTGVSSAAFGDPNDEGLGSHPLYGHGLEGLLWAGEVDKSDGTRRHFLVPTKEGLAEVWAHAIDAIRIDHRHTASDVLRSVPRLDAPAARPEPEKVQAEAFTDQSNYAVIRLPQRRFPGVVFQGDSLSTFVSDAQELASVSRGANAEVAELSADLRDRLGAILDHYEQALAKHGVPLPYVRDATPNIRPIDQMGIARAAAHDETHQLMQLAAGPPSHWVVTLVDGAQVDVWADAVTGSSGPDDARDYAFGVLMDIDPNLQDQFDVTARTPSNPGRVEVCVARFPRSSVLDVSSG
ncbi:hypothetical protein SAMN05892883_3109 [Jatrophihabitans sp. GAS493]|uniref:DUF6959 family protein n=1 Tax=Jatrophihabitans sp. GAS493 TaxID=1907575 RepID=UPI000BBF9E7A|nr:hypothetical protein [Jatrophihabitans sp. GAS493]SOD73917.1 hypothetical protein SAMN05892883_3109 [Jatrophihabitans sp. GAS493]